MNEILKNLYEFFFRPRKPDVFTGVLPDSRSESTKAGDLQFHDIVPKASVAIAVWAPLDDAKLPTWPVLDQAQTSGCVAFTKSLMSSIVYYLRTGVFVQMSPHWIYSQRVNKPEEGMMGYDAFDIESTAGIVPEDLVPSEGLSEYQLSNYNAQPWEKDIAKALRMSDQRVILPAKDIDTVASVMQVTGKPIMVFFTFAYNEWTRPVPVVMTSAPPYAHSVTFVPPRTTGECSFGIYNGKKAIVIQDSWGITANAGTLTGKRIITEDFYASRNYFAAYSMRFKFDEQVGGKPTYDGTVVSVQKCLRYEGCFPSNISYVENLGPTTKKSIAQFQLKHLITVSSTLDSATITLLKELYP